MRQSCRHLDNTHRTPPPAPGSALDVVDLIQQKLGTGVRPESIEGLVIVLRERIKELTGKGQALEEQLREVDAERQAERSLIKSLQLRQRFETSSALFPELQNGDVADGPHGDEDSASHDEVARLYAENKRLKQELLERSANEDDIMMLTEEVQRLKDQLAQERSQNSPMVGSTEDEVAMYAAQAAEAQRMYQAAKEAAQRCSEDADLAMEEVRESKTLQKELNDSLSTAVEEIDRLYGFLQEKEGFLLEGPEQPKALCAGPGHWTGRDGVRKGRPEDARDRAFVLARMLCDRWRRAFEELLLHLCFELWRMKKDARVRLRQLQLLQEERDTLQKELRWTRASQPCVSGSSGAKTSLHHEGGAPRNLISTCVRMVDDIMLGGSGGGGMEGGEGMGLESLAVSGVSTGSFHSRGTMALSGLRREVAGLRAALQSQRTMNSSIMQIISQYEKRYREERQVEFFTRSDLERCEAVSDDCGPQERLIETMAFCSSNESTTGSKVDSDAAVEGVNGSAPDPRDVVDRVEKFCVAVGGWMDEHVVLNKQLEDMLADCRCARF